jgi:hypothetical protein
LVQKPVGFHADLMKATHAEGLGYDHEQWLQAKDKYRSSHGISR